MRNSCNGVFFLCTLFTSLGCCVHVKYVPYLHSFIPIVPQTNKLKKWHVIKSNTLYPDM